MGTYTLKGADAHPVLTDVSVGVEYEATEQHGGLWGGTIYRRYYYIPDCSGLGGSVAIPLGFTWTGLLVGIGGCALTKDGSEWLPLPFTDFGSATRSVEVKVNTVSEQIIMIAGSNQDWQPAGAVWIDYTRP